MTPTEALKLKAQVVIIHGLEAAVALDEITTDTMQQSIAIASLNPEFVMEKSRIDDEERKHNSLSLFRD